ncbi:TPA: DUF1272 domain-containing protein [Pseudomonas aeruginosa]|nr:DUF1272 domain-containing protein [Pseudomonas aeruginosa]
MLELRPNCECCDRDLPGDKGNSLVAALMSFGSGALITSLGWNAVNLLVWPALLVALTLLWPVRRTRTLSR